MWTGVTLIPDMGDSFVRNGLVSDGYGLQSGPHPALSSSSEDCKGVSLSAENESKLRLNNLKG